MFLSGVKATVDEAVGNSFVGRYFEVKERGSVFSRELLGGIVTFLTVAYIIPVNARIIADTGGTCVHDLPGQFFGDPEFDSCVSQIRKDLITATCAVTIVATAIMGFIAKYPIVCMPGMGLNAYFVYTVVGFGGTGQVTYENALAAVVIEGIIFFILSITGWRTLIAKAFPLCVRHAVAGGIGFFLAFIGLQGSEGLGLIMHDDATLVKLGGCKLEYRKYLVPAGGYVCTRGRMEDPTLWLGAFGGLAMVFCLHKRVNGGLMFGILGVSILSWFRGSSTVTYFPKTEDGNTRFDYFKQVVDFNPIKKTAGALDFDLGTSEIWVALITFLYTDLLDTTGTLYSITKQAGFLRPDGTFKRAKAAFSADALGTVLAGLLGCSPVVSAVESMAGVEAGARTGIAAIVAMLMFFISMFFAPIFASIPPFATGPALVIVGALMMKNLRLINWDDITEALPAFLTVILMPLTYSIAYGLVGGVCSYLAIQLCGILWDIVSRKKTLSQTFEDFIARFQNNPDSGAEEDIGLQKGGKHRPSIQELLTPNSKDTAKAPTATVMDTSITHRMDSEAKDNYTV